MLLFSSPVVQFVGDWWCSTMYDGILDTRENVRYISPIDSYIYREKLDALLLFFLVPWGVKNTMVWIPLDINFSNPQYMRWKQTYFDGSTSKRVRNFIGTLKCSFCVCVSREQCITTTLHVLITIVFWLPNNIFY